MIHLTILLPEHTHRALRDMAQRDSVPISIKAFEYIEDGLDAEDDELWDAFVESMEEARCGYVDGPVVA